MDEEAPKKINADQVEVIDAQGHVIQESKEGPQGSGRTHEADRPFAGKFGGGFGQVRIFRGGPAMLLLLPLLIPFALIAFFLLIVFALIFGRRVFKVVRFR